MKKRIFEEKKKIIKKKEKNSLQSKIHNHNIHNSYNQEGIKLISLIKKDNPVLIKLSMNNNNKIKEISNSEQIINRPLKNKKFQYNHQIITIIKILIIKITI